MKGIIGRFFFQFGVTISVAVLLSLLEALTLAPMRCSRFLEVEHRGRLGRRRWTGCSRRLAAAYRRALGPALRHRGLVLGGGLASSSCSLCSSSACCEQEFVPLQDSSRFRSASRPRWARASTPPTASSARSRSDLLARPEVALYSGTWAASAAARSARACFVTMKDPGERPRDPERAGR